jgi:hypothetical protein
MSNGRRFVAAVANSSNGAIERICRRCSSALPEPVLKIVERVVEKVVIRHDPQCLESLEEARKLILAATERLRQQQVAETAPAVLARSSFRNAPKMRNKEVCFVRDR